MLPTIDIGSIGAITAIGAFFSACWKVISNFASWVKEKAVIFSIAHRMWATSLFIGVITLLVLSLASIVARFISWAGSFAIGSLTAGTDVKVAYKFVNQLLPLDGLLAIIPYYLSVLSMYFTFTGLGFGFWRACKLVDFLFNGVKT